MKPIVLIAATTRWFSTARLAMALADAGCVVDAVCPSGHPIFKTSALRRAHLYQGLAPLTSFAEAIVSSKADLVIPSDDLSTRHLHELYSRGKASTTADGDLCALIAHSLGLPEHFSTLYARTKLLEIAREEGIRVPDGAVIPDLHHLTEWTAKNGFPAVLKTDGSSGGGGVRITNTIEEARRAFKKLSAPPLFARVVKRVLIDRDLTLVWPLLLRRRPVVNVQSFVPGREATSLVVCWKGAVLAGLHFEVLNKQNTTGPASVLRRMDNSEMSSAAEKLARRLGLSGLHGFDFMLENETGNPYLIEMNPRTTQVGHLALGPGRDIPAALYAALSGKPVGEAPSVTQNDTIALFPQEWSRDPASPFLQSAYHDVPWAEAELMRACVRKQRRWGALYSQQKWGELFSATHLTRL